jgi:hypothetical protein
VATAVPVGDDLPPPPAPAPAPPPITDPDELAEEIAALMPGYDAIPGAMVLDRVLDGLVWLAGTDQPATARALAPVLDRAKDVLVDHPWERGCLHGALGVALRAVVDNEPRWGRWARLLNALRSGRPASAWPVPTLPGPHAVLLSRLAEIGERVRADPPRGLLASPVWANGAVDASTLLGRLAAAGDREPWPADLVQALLRLPAVVDEEAAARATKLRTPAGDRLAVWLRAGGLPRPEYRMVTVSRFDGVQRWEPAGAPDGRVVVEARPSAGSEDLLGLLTVRATADEPHPAARLWPAVLPGYRALVAAWVQPGVAATADIGLPGAAAVLPLLAECTGEGGTAVDVALAYGLAARHEPDRVAAFDAVLALAASDRLDPVGVGTHLGELARHGKLTASRCVSPLRDAAAAGARLTTWRILAAALPPLLAMPKPPAGTPDLLTLAAETAAATGEAIPVPGLAEVAARGGSTRLVAEARRLAAVP